MRETKLTFCRICEASCGLEVTVEDNQVVQVQPDAEHPVTRGYACIKGMRFHEVHSSPDRLLHPLKRVGDRWERIDWEQATREIGQKLRKLVDAHGPDSIAFYVGSPMVYNYAATILQNGLVYGLGTRSVYGAGSQDCNNKFLVQQHMYGSPFRITLPDLPRVQMLLVVGANPAVSQGTFMQTPRVVEHFKRIVSRGGRVVFLNPRRTESARAVGEQVFVRPDTDVFFLLAFLRELIAQGGVDHDHVQSHMRGLDKLTRFAQPWTPERVAPVTGVAASTLRELVSAYRKARGAALYCGTGVNQGSNGSLAFWALEAINAISGNLDRDGGTVVGEGLFDMASILKKQGRLERTDRTRVGGLPSVNDTFPAGVLADEILTPGPGQVKALFNLAGNPVLSCPNAGGRLDKALKELELLVCLDIFRNETGNLAHYVLPSTTFLERPDLPMVMHWMAGTQTHRHVQYTPRLLTPPKDVREEGWVFLEIAREAGIPLFGSRVADLSLRAMQAMGRLPGLGKHLELTSERLIDFTLRGARGAAPLKDQLRKYPRGQSFGENRAGNFLGKRVLTPDGKIDLAPQSFLDRADQLEADFQRELRDRKQLKVISKRERLSHNSWMHNTPPFVGRQRHTNYLYMHPKDAAQRGLSDGQQVRITSAKGEVRAPLKLSEDMMPGAVALPHGWGHAAADALTVAHQHPGVNANLLTPDGPEHCEPLSGMSHMTGFSVEVTHAQARAEAGDAASTKPENPPLPS